MKLSMVFGGDTLPGGFKLAIAFALLAWSLQLAGLPTLAALSVLFVAALGANALLLVAVRAFIRVCLSYRRRYCEAGKCKWCRLERRKRG